MISIKKIYKNFLLVIIFFFISYLNYYNFYYKSFSSSILYKIHFNEKDKIKNELLNNFFSSNYNREESFLIKRLSKFKEKFGDKYKYYPITNNPNLQYNPSIHNKSHSNQSYQSKSKNYNSKSHNNKEQKIYRPIEDYKNFTTSSASLYQNDDDIDLFRSKIDELFS